MRAAFLLLTILLATNAFAQNLARVEAIIAPTPNFELCLGTISLEPTVTFKNLDSVSHDLRTMIRIINEFTGITVYSDTTILLNVAPGLVLAHTFKPYLTNPNILSQLGRFRVMASTEVVNSNGEVVPESDTADNIDWVNLFGLRRVAIPLQDASDDYYVLTSEFGGHSVPTQFRWITIGVTTVDAEFQTFSPPTPNSILDTGSIGPLAYKAPAMRFDRRDVAGIDYEGSDVGDTLLSFPINLNGYGRGPTVAFAFHRSTRRQYSAISDGKVLLGPEATILSADGSVARPGDSLLLEFRHPADSMCGDNDARWIATAAFDGGKDFEWGHCSVPLDSAKLGLNYLTPNFRLRLRLSAKNDAISGEEDEDDWYVDNLVVWAPRHPEAVMNWARAASPYTRMPRSQAFYPLYARLSWIDHGWTPAPVYLKISDPEGRMLHFDTAGAALNGRSHDTIARARDWDASRSLLNYGDRLMVTAWVSLDFFNNYSEDDAAHSYFHMNTGDGPDFVQEFALDDGTNDIPAMTKIDEDGIGFKNTSGSFAMRFRLTKPDTLFGARLFFGSTNSALDAIRITVHRGSDSSDVPGEVIERTVLETTRKLEMPRGFASYQFTDPVEVPPGDYWLSVSQLSLDNMTLGADISRNGFDLVVSGESPRYRYIHDSPYGSQYAVNANSGDISRMLAFEMPARSGNWKPLTPENALDSLNG
ncbi:MAG TPA: hypothetical protein VFH43_07465, partial [Candidatus Kapabacteria bacterium]|nr:hypothetical protein [Candidatus Kapabacteria bacterium]